MASGYPAIQPAIPIMAIAEPDLSHLTTCSFEACIAFQQQVEEYRVRHLAGPA